jgi:hypothetical protein
MGGAPRAPSETCVASDPEPFDGPGSLADEAGGPPADWLERVRRGAPHLYASMQQRSAVTGTEAAKSSRPMRRAPHPPHSDTTRRPGPKAEEGRAAEVVPRAHRGPIGPRAGATASVPRREGSELPRLPSPATPQAAPVGPEVAPPSAAPSSAAAPRPAGSMSWVRWPGERAAPAPSAPASPSKQAATAPPHEPPPRYEAPRIARSVAPPSQDRATDRATGVAAATAVGDGAPRRGTPTVRRAQVERTNTERARGVATDIARGHAAEADTRAEAARTWVADSPLRVGPHAERRAAWWVSSDGEQEQAARRRPAAAAPAPATYRASEVAGASFAPRTSPFTETSPPPRFVPRPKVGDSLVGDPLVGDPLVGDPLVGDHCVDGSKGAARGDDPWPSLPEPGPAGLPSVGSAGVSAGHPHALYPAASVASMRLRELQESERWNV